MSWSESPRAHCAGPICTCSTGRVGAEPGLVLGHEPLGIVEEVGTSVEMVRRGERVVIPTHIFCGLCVNCARGYSASCLRIRPGGFGAAYGYAGMGPYRGAQAELLRVPFGDANCVPVPGEPGDDREDDFVLLADAFVTGWHATELAAVAAADTVAVFGAGTIGLLAAYSSLLRGASEVYVVDSIEARLAKAAEIGAVPVDFTKGDPVDQIRNLRAERPGGLPPGEDKMVGVDCCIDAVGFQARDRQDPSRGASGPGHRRPGQARQPDRPSGDRRSLHRKGPGPGAPRQLGRRAAHPMGNAFQQGRPCWIREDQRPPLHGRVA
jgi:glutathione-independent formaldehyde dehydrogenase